MMDAGGSFELTGLEQGSYSITIIDSSDDACPFVLPLIVVNGPEASVTISSISDVSCTDAEDGCITLSVIGNDPSILWSNGAMTEEVCGLEGGFYSVTVTDGACENVLSDIFVFEPDSLVAKTTAIQHVSCFGENDGAISVLIGGGNGPYQFLWSNGVMTQNVSNLEAGTYFLTVTDQNNCVLEVGPMVVEQPDLLELVATIDSISCPGAMDGAINLIVTGGTEPYSYAWNTGGNLPGQDNLGPGVYQVTITDAQDCQVSGSFDMSDPTILEATLIAANTPSCAGLSDGSLEVSVTGGFPPYSYNWSSGDTLSMATGSSGRKLPGYHYRC